MSGVTTAVADTNDRSLLAAFTRLGEWVLAPIYSTSVDATALWDYHVRIGGATGPDLTPTESARVRPLKSPRAVILLPLMVYIALGAS
ncbi:hypothetical protein CMEL01_05897 [Colletotrichum melonis]|uniref:Uncharacterized protein n=1 Tax=Colletotrichum melonis TaxID=1209925 RepID=A0AAI9U6Q0_9PEZI|nr:hypothetical protein CMEL01_05897 [Colletotrichum melonis]